MEQFASVDIIKLGSDQHPDSNSAEKSHDTAHLGSQFLIESKLALLSTQQANEMRGWGQEEENLFGESADWEDAKLASQNNHLSGI